MTLEDLYSGYSQRGVIGKDVTLDSFVSDMHSTGKVSALRSSAIEKGLTVFDEDNFQKQVSAMVLEYDKKHSPFGDRFDNAGVDNTTAAPMRPADAPATETADTPAPAQRPKDFDPASLRFNGPGADGVPVAQPFSTSGGNTPAPMPSMQRGEYLDGMSEEGFRRMTPVQRMEYANMSEEEKLNKFQRYADDKLIGEFISSDEGSQFLTGSIEAAGQERDKIVEQFQESNDYKMIVAKWQQRVAELAKNEGLTFDTMPEDRKKELIDDLNSELALAMNTKYQSELQSLDENMIAGLRARALDYVTTGASNDNFRERRKQMNNDMRIQLESEKQQLRGSLLSGWETPFVNFTAGTYGMVSGFRSFLRHNSELATRVANESFETDQFAGGKGPITALVDALTDGWLDEKVASTGNVLEGHRSTGAVGDGFANELFSGNFGNATRALVNGAAYTMPNLIASFVAGISGHPEVGMALLGATAGGQKWEEIKDRDDMTDSQKELSVLGAIIAETVTEGLGSARFLKKYGPAVAPSRLRMATERAYIAALRSNPRLLEMVRNGKTAIAGYSIEHPKFAGAITGTGKAVGGFYDKAMDKYGEGLTEVLTDVLNDTFDRALGVTDEEIGTDNFMQYLETFAVSQLSDRVMGAANRAAVAGTVYDESRSKGYGRGTSAGIAARTAFSGVGNTALRIAQYLRRDKYIGELYNSPFYRDIIQQTGLSAERVADLITRDGSTMSDEDKRDLQAFRFAERTAIKMGGAALGMYRLTGINPQNLSRLEQQYITGLIADIMKENGKPIEMLSEDRSKMSSKDRFFVNHTLPDLVKARFDDFVKNHGFNPNIYDMTDEEKAEYDQIVDAAEEAAYANTEQTGDATGGNVEVEETPVAGEEANAPEQGVGKESASSPEASPTEQSAPVESSRGPKKGEVKDASGKKPINYFWSGQNVVMMTDGSINFAESGPVSIQRNGSAVKIGSNERAEVEEKVNELLRAKFNEEHPDIVEARERAKIEHDAELVGEAISDREAEIKRQAEKVTKAMVGKDRSKMSNEEKFVTLWNRNQQAAIAAFQSRIAEIDEAIKTASSKKNAVDAALENMDLENEKEDITRILNFYAPDALNAPAVPPVSGGESSNQGQPSSPAAQTNQQPAAQQQTAGAAPAQSSEQSTASPQQQGTQSKKQEEKDAKRESNKAANAERNAELNKKAATSKATKQVRRISHLGDKATLKNKEDIVNKYDQAVADGAEVTDEMNSAINALRDNISKHKADLESAAKAKKEKDAAKTKEKDEAAAEADKDSLARFESEYAKNLVAELEKGLKLQKQRGKEVWFFHKGKNQYAHGTIQKDGSIVLDDTYASVLGEKTVKKESVKELLLLRAYRPDAEGKAEQVFILVKDGTRISDVRLKGRVATGGIRYVALINSKGELESQATAKANAEEYTKGYLIAEGTAAREAYDEELAKGKEADPDKLVVLKAAYDNIVQQQEQRNEEGRRLKNAVNGSLIYIDKDMQKPLRPDVSYLASSKKEARVLDIQKRLKGFHSVSGIMKAVVMKVYEKIITVEDFFGGSFDVAQYLQDNSEAGDVRRNKDIVAALAAKANEWIDCINARLEELGVTDKSVSIGHIAPKGEKDSLIAGLKQVGSLLRAASQDKTNKVNIPGKSQRPYYRYAQNTLNEKLLEVQAAIHGLEESDIDGQLSEYAKQELAKQHKILDALQKELHWRELEFANGTRTKEGTTEDSELAEVRGDVKKITGKTNELKGEIKRLEKEIKSTDKPLSKEEKQAVNDEIAELKEKKKAEQEKHKDKTAKFNEIKKSIEREEKKVKDNTKRRSDLISKQKEEIEGLKRVAEEQKNSTDEKEKAKVKDTEATIKKYESQLETLGDDIQKEIQDSEGKIKSLNEQLKEFDGVFDSENALQAQIDEKQRILDRSNERQIAITNAKKRIKAINQEFEFRAKEAEIRAKWKSGKKVEQGSDAGSVVDNLKALAESASDQHTETAIPVVDESIELSKDTKMRSLQIQSFLNGIARNITPIVVTRDSVAAALKKAGANQNVISKAAAPGVTAFMFGGNIYFLAEAISSMPMARRKYYHETCHLYMSKFIGKMEATVAKGVSETVKVIADSKVEKFCLAHIAELKNIVHVVSNGGAYKFFEYKDKEIGGEKLLPLFEEAMAHFSEIYYTENDWQKWFSDKGVELSDDMIKFLKKFAKERTSKDNRLPNYKNTYENAKRQSRRNGNVKHDLATRNDIASNNTESDQRQDDGTGERRGLQDVAGLYADSGSGEGSGSGTGVREDSGRDAGSGRGAGSENGSDVEALDLSVLHTEDELGVTAFATYKEVTNSMSLIEMYEMGEANLDVDSERKRLADNIELLNAQYKAYKLQKDSLTPSIDGDVAEDFLDDMAQEACDLLDELIADPFFGDDSFRYDCQELLYAVDDVVDDDDFHQWLTDVATFLYDRGVCPPALAANGFVRGVDGVEDAEYNNIIDNWMKFETRRELMKMRQHAIEDVKRHDNPLASKEDVARFMQELDDVRAEAEKNGTFMQTPTGAETKLSEFLWCVVRTATFRDWFGDWQNSPEYASKVIDKETGEPKLLYHGTYWNIAGSPVPFLFTNTGSSDLNHFGIYTTDNRDVAAFFGNNSYESVAADNYEETIFGGVFTLFANIRNPFITSFADSNGNPQYYNAHPKYKVYNVGAITFYDINTAFADALAYCRENYDSIPEDMKVGEKYDEQKMIDMLNSIASPATTDLINRWAYENGYDGTIMEDVVEEGSGADNTDVCVFDGSQLKSPLGNYSYRKDTNNVFFSLVGTKMVEADEKMKPARLALLEKAIDMDAHGIDHNTIWAHTGWVKFVDGKWRMEIPFDGKIKDFDGIFRSFLDAQKNLPEGMNYEDALDTIMDALDANGVEYYINDDGAPIVYLSDSKGVSPQLDGLLNAYPSLNNATVVFDYIEDGSTGYVADVDGTLEIHVAVNNTLTEDALIDTLTHEVQHIIQAEEGFEGGTNVEFVQESALESVDRSIRQTSALLQEVQDAIAKGEDWKNGTGMTVPNAMLQDMRASLAKDLEDMKAFKQQIESEDGYEAFNEYYRKMLGELEAEAVAIRTRMTDDERGTISPRNQFLEKDGSVMPDWKIGLLTRMSSDNPVGRADRGVSHYDRDELVPSLEGELIGESPEDYDPQSITDEQLDNTSLAIEKQMAILSKMSAQMPPVATGIRLGLLAKVIYKLVDNTHAILVMQNAINKWRKEHGLEPMSEEYDVRNMVNTVSSATGARVKLFRNGAWKKLTSHISDVMLPIIEKAMDTELSFCNDFVMWEEKVDSITGERTFVKHKPTAYDLLNYYVIARDNVERVEFGINPRGQEAFFEMTANVEYTNEKGELVRGLNYADYVKLFEAAVKNSSSTALKELWYKINACTRTSLDELLEGRIITQDYYNELARRKYYAPEKGFMENVLDGRDLESGTNRPAGPRTTPSAIAYAAKGGESLAGDVLDYIKQDVENAIAVGQKNKPKAVFVELLMKNPEFMAHYNIPMPKNVWYVRSERTVLKDGEEVNEPYWEMTFEEPSQDDKERQKELLSEISAEKRKLNRKGLTWMEREQILDGIKQLESQLPFATNDMVRDLFSQYRETPMDAKDKRGNELSTEEVKVYIDGRSMLMNFPNMSMLANGLNDIVNTSGRGYRMMRAIAGFFSGMYVTFNPAFALVNLGRDIPFVVAKGAAEYGPMFDLYFMREWANIKGVHKQIGYYLNNKQIDRSTDDGELFYQFITAGGQTGYANLERLASLRDWIENKNGRGDWLKSAVDIWTVPNEYSELFTRFCIYKAVLRLGKSNADAIKAAKNLSVNFNRHGYGGPGLSALTSMSMFANAAIQGACGLWRTFDTKKHTVRAIGTMVAIPMILGYATTLAGSLGMDDDDELKDYYLELTSDYNHDNYFILGPIRKALNEQMKPFFVMGVNIAMMQKGARSPQEAFQSCFETIFRNIVPLAPALNESIIETEKFLTGRGSGIGGGLGNIILSLAVPQQYESLVNISHGVTKFGKVLRHDDSEIPEYRYNENEAKMYRDIAQMLYVFGGGKDYYGTKHKMNEDGSLKQMSSLFDVSPAMVKEVMRTIAPFPTDLLATIWQLSDDEDKFRPQDAVFVRNFYNNSNYDMWEYSQIKAAREELKKMNGYKEQLLRNAMGGKEGATEAYIAFAEKNESYMSNLKAVIDMYNTGSSYGFAQRFGWTAKEMEKKFPMFQGDGLRATRLSAAFQARMLMDERKLK